MNRAPTFEDIFAVMSAASVGDTTTRVALPDDPQVGDTETKFALALNVLLDDLSLRAAVAERLAERLNILVTAAQEFSANIQDPERLLSAVARRLAEVVKDQCVVRLISDDGRELVPVAVHGADEETKCENDDDEKTAFWISSGGVRQSIGLLAEL